MYPTQDVSEIDSALEDLEVKSRRVIGSAEALVAEMEDGQARTELQEKFKNFSGRWMDRLDTEKRTWEERKLSLKSLGEALP